MAESCAKIFKIKISVTMKKNIYRNVLEMAKSKSVLAVFMGMILVSCGTQMGGYSETDGVYYDPNKDTLPEGIIINNEGNQVGEYYDYNLNQPSIIENSEKNTFYQQNRFENWNNNTPDDSDWGVYAGNETNYYDNFWGNPWGFYNSYWGSGFGLGFSWGWGSPYGGWYGFNPYWDFGFSPYWYGMYHPYHNFYGFGMPYYAYYNPYYGYYSPYYYGNGYNYRRSGANGRLNNSYTQGGLNRMSNQNARFRSNSNSALRTMPQNNGFRQNNNQPRMRSEQPRYQNNNTRQYPQQTQPRTRSYDNGGFRSSGDGGFRSGGMNNSTGGSRSGGTRSGGFR